MSGAVAVREEGEWESGLDARECFAEQAGWEAKATALDADLRKPYSLGGPSDDPEFAAYCAAFEANRQVIQARLNHARTMATLWLERARKALGREFESGAGA